MIYIIKLGCVTYGGYSYLLDRDSIGNIGITWSMPDALRFSQEEAEELCVKINEEQRRYNAEPCEVYSTFFDCRCQKALLANREAIAPFLAKWHPSNEPLTRIGSGGSADVYDLGDGHILRISAADYADVIPNHPRANPRIDGICFDHDKEWSERLSLEVFPKVDEILTALDYAEQASVIVEISSELAQAGIYYWDVYGQNVGRKHGGEWMVIDAGCFRK